MRRLLLRLLIYACVVIASFFVSLDLVDYFDASSAQTVLLMLRVAPTGKRAIFRHRFRNRNWKATRTRSQFRNSAALLTRSADCFHRRSCVKVITEWGRPIPPS